METIVVKVTKEKNWAGNDYLLFNGDKYGVIAEVDYPTKYRIEPRVYFLKNDNDFSIEKSIFSAMTKATDFCEKFLAEKGFTDIKFVYPKTIKVK